jgi:hypothetical protein
MNGQCLCGAVQVSAPNARQFGACHCTTCRRWGGGPMLAVHCGTEVTFTGQGQIGRYASSEWAERGFCMVCGTHLYYRLQATGEWFLPAGLLDGTALEMTNQIFINSKPDYYAFANQTPVYTGQQFMEMVSGGESA